MSLNPNGSHLPALIACVLATDGPVLELGMGVFSTPVLHALCYSSRRLLSLDSDRAAIYNFSQLAERDHEIRYSPDYGDLDEISKEPWSVVLVDNWPSERRAGDVLKFSHAEFVVVHDFDAESVGPPILSASKGVWPFVKVYDKFQPPTLVLGKREVPSLP